VATPRALVYGLAVAGEATVAALQRHGYDVVAADDTVDEAKFKRAEELGVTLHIGATFDPDTVGEYDVLAPSPGIPETHPVILAAFEAGVPLRTELELAYRWEQERAAERGGAARPILAITGTDGKTSTTELTVAILRAAGRRAADVGNTDTPMVTAIDWTGPSEVDVFVAECTSFRLAWTEQFRADAAVWLNLAPDHLNWHTDLDSYVAAKSRIFSLQRPSDVAIGNASDPIVMDHLGRAPGRRRTFATSGADYRVERLEVDGVADTWLVGPDGPIAATSTMRRALPHDLTNALAASALVLETGLARPEHIAAALSTFSAPPHRLEPVGEAGGVHWYNDSKATTPHAAATAIRAFDKVVLIAGGSRKGVDLSPMGAYPDRMRAVVAIGQAGPDVAAVFGTTTQVATADDMAAAVATAGALAEPGDAVVLSPGCASFDWYANYMARGDDYRQKVLEYLSDNTTLTSQPIDTEAR
jgi:UDP-N-acetylmuramoylalanine--D-glutamate ligase